MKNAVFIIVLFCFACKKEQSATPSLSTCIDAKVNKFKTESRLTGFSSVTEYKLNNKCYYEFDYGKAADWSAYILDNQCDTICVSNGLAGSKCTIDNFFQKAVKTKVVFE